MKNFYTIFHFIELHTVLTPEQKNLIFSCLQKTAYRKNAIILHPSDVSDKVFFVESGILREYTINDKGEDITTQLVAENTFFFSTLSYLSGQSANRTVEVLEDCTLICIRRSSFVDLRNQMPDLNDFYIKMLENALMGFEMRLDLLRIKDSGERLDAFEKLQPELRNRIMRKHVASYLGVTQSTLSKIKLI